MTLNKTNQPITSRPAALCVFCGSNVGTKPEYAQAARDLGAEMARRGISLVYGGGKVGLMGVVADAVLASGGDVTGVIPRALARTEIAHDGLTALHVVESMHERKALMAKLSGGFIALPGGFGTFEEFCEAVTWTQLGLHEKPCALLNVAGFYTPLLHLFDGATASGFIGDTHRALVLADDDIPRLLDRIAAYEHHAGGALDKLLSRDATVATPV